MINPLTDNQRQAIEAAIFAERKIQAIKLYREATGAGLAEAKDAVEKLETELRERHPEDFGPKPASTGCAGMLVLLFVAAALVIGGALRFGW